MPEILPAQQTFSNANNRHYKPNNAVSLSITPINDDPVLGNDTFTIDEDTTNNTIDVLANDTLSPDLSETLTITATSAASNGVVNIAGGTSVTYSPAANFFGTDAFTYTITDGRGGSSTALVTITVENANNDPPTVTSDSFTVAENSLGNSFDVIANDSHDPDPAETLTLLSLGSLSNGSATIVGNSISYSPASDFTGAETLTYTVQDDGGATAQGSVTVSVQDMTSPTISGIAINANITDPIPLPKGPVPTSWSQQRSTLNTIVVTLSEDIAIVSPSDLTLTNLGVNASVDADTLVGLEPHHISVASHVLTLIFETNELGNGVYSLTLHNTIKDLANLPLDGNGDGSGGDDYKFRGNSANSFVRQVADFPGNAGVSVFDFTTFSYWFGTNVPDAPDYVDLNRDGGISIFDFSVFSQNFGQGVIYPIAFAGRAVTPTTKTADQLKIRETTQRADRAIDQLFHEATSDDATLDNIGQHRRAQDTRLELPRLARSDSLALTLDQIAADIAEIFN